MDILSLRGHARLAAAAILWHPCCMRPDGVVCPELRHLWFERHEVGGHGTALSDSSAGFMTLRRMRQSRLVDSQAGDPNSWMNLRTKRPNRHRILEILRSWGNVWPNLAGSPAPVLERMTSASFLHDQFPIAFGLSESSERGMREFVRSEVHSRFRDSHEFRLIEELEVCSGRARVDLALIGELLTGFEIKGPKDKVSRLPSQAKAYSECFDRVILVVHQSLAEKAIPLVPDWWGVVVGIQQGDCLSYEVRRSPQANPNLNLEAVLSLLWKAEIETLHADLIGEAPKPKATKRVIRANLLSRVTHPELHSRGLRKLRERSEWREAFSAHA